uniref:CCHC-type domain-containing protein n=1 Tax=Cannabis sativa TaxID=3483 RepID=A0A803QPD1_CANSA
MIEDDDLSEIDDRWCIVGKFLTKRIVDFQAVQHKMATLWQPGRGMYVKELHPNHFLFQFYHEVDIERVIEGSPWTFDRAPLIFERVKPGENPRSIQLNCLEYWIQLHDMTSGFMSERVARDVGNYIGQYVKSDPNNFSGVWRDYLRIRVKIRVDKPLEQSMRLEKKSGVFCVVRFKYEDLSTFCFICGVLGHSERFCERLFDTPPHLIKKPYSLELKAAPRRRHYNMGSQWLRSGVVSKQGEPSSHSSDGGQQSNGMERNQGAGITVGTISHELANEYGNNLLSQPAGREGDIQGKSKAIVLNPQPMQNITLPKIQVTDLKRRKTIMEGFYSEDKEENGTGPQDNNDDRMGGSMEGDVVMGFGEEDIQKNFIGAGSGSQARRAL